MAQELKIRISAFKSLEEKLKSLNATFIDEFLFKDIYCSQPAGEVLKLAKINEPYSLQRLKATNGKFDSVEKPKINISDVERK